MTPLFTSIVGELVADHLASRGVSRTLQRRQTRAEAAEPLCADILARSYEK